MFQHTPNTPPELPPYKWDPQFTSLPNELLLEIANKLTSLKVLNSLLKCNRHLSALLTPLLHKKILTRAGAPPLHLAAKDGHLSLAKLAISNNHPIDRIHRCKRSKSRRPEWGWDYNPKFVYHRESALFYAVRFGHRDVVAFLLENGASIKSVNGKGNCLLRVATDAGHLQVVELLLEASADTQVERLKHPTPLAVATVNRRGDIVGALLANGAVSDSVNSDCDTALHIATRKGYEEIVGQLLEVRPGAVNKDRWDFGGYAAVHLASIYGHVETVRKLLAEGVDVDCLDSRGMAPLHHAVEKADAALVRFLLQRGADVDRCGVKRGVTPLCYALGAPWRRKRGELEWGDYMVVKMLVERGAYVDAAYESRTALDYAVELADCWLKGEIVELLESVGARRWDDIPVGYKPVPPFGWPDG